MLRELDSLGYVALGRIRLTLGLLSKARIGGG